MPRCRRKVEVLAVRILVRYRTAHAPDFVRPGIVVVSRLEYTQPVSGKKCLMVSRRYVAGCQLLIFFKRPKLIWLYILPNEDSA